MNSNEKTKSTQGPVTRLPYFLTSQNCTKEINEREILQQPYRPSYRLQETYGKPLTYSIRPQQPTNIQPKVISIVQHDFPKPTPSQTEVTISKDRYEQIRGKYDSLLNTKSNIDLEADQSRNHSEYQRIIADLKSQIQSLKSSQRREGASSDEKDQKIELLQNKVSSLQTQLQKKPKFIKIEKVQKLETVIEPADLREEINSLEKQLGDLSRTIQAQSEVIKGIESLKDRDGQKLLEGFQFEILNKNRKIEQLEQDLKQVDTLQQQLKDQQELIEQIEGLQNQITEKNYEINLLKTDKNSLEKFLEKIRKEKLLLEEQGEKQLQKSQQLEEFKQGLKSTRDLLSLREKEIENLKQLNKKSNQQESQDSQLLLQIKELERSNEQRQRMIDSLKDQIGNLENYKEQQMGFIDSLQEQI